MEVKGMVLSDAVMSGGAGKWVSQPRLITGLRTKMSSKGKKVSMVTSSLMMEERDFGKERSGAAMTFFRESWQSSFHVMNDEVGQFSRPIYNPEVAHDRVALAEEDELWLQIRAEARRDSEEEPALASFLYSTILAHRSLERALAFHLGNKLASATFLGSQLFSLILDTFMEDGEIRQACRADILAVKERDPACVSYTHCMLNFKGFLACQTHRVSHSLWKSGRRSLALAIQSRISEVFDVDIHPAAKIGKGIIIDHATGVVIGETTTIGDNVSILHHVTLGGTGKHMGDRHPKIGNGVLIGAGATILGPIKVGDGAKIGSLSVVLTDIPPHTTAVGNPARLVGGKKKPIELTDTPSQTMDHISFVSNWSDYVI